MGALKHLCSMKRFRTQVDDIGPICRVLELSSCEILLLAIAPSSYIADGTWFAFGDFDRNMEAEFVV